MLIKSLRIKNLLSFGPDTEMLPLAQLNVLIGPNGSGKSNFLEAISLLQAAPKDLSAPVKEIGGVRDWLWKGKPKAVASLEVLLENPRGKMPLRHVMNFTEHGSRFELVEERIENEHAFPGKNAPYFFYRFRNGYPVLKVTPSEDAEAAQATVSYDSGTENDRELKRETLNPEQSILSQVKDPERYPVLAYLDSSYGRIFRPPRGRHDRETRSGGCVREARRKNGDESVKKGRLSLMAGQLPPRAVVDQGSARGDTLVSVYLYIEGGGPGADSKDVDTRCREGFHKFLEKCGFAAPARMPRLVACGARKAAFDAFKNAQKRKAAGDFVALWVDSEEPLANLEATWIAS